jgi:hypothetical protein
MGAITPQGKTLDICFLQTPPWTISHKPTPAYDIPWVASLEPLPWHFLVALNVCSHMLSLVMGTHTQGFGLGVLSWLSL